MSELSDPLLILCGGLSRRMGGSKALLPYQGKRLIDYQVNEYSGMVYLASAGVRFNGLPEKIQYIPDALDGRKGPLSGILSGLREASINGYHGIFVMACDTLVKPVALIQLLSLKKATCAWRDGIVVVDEGEQLHPLQSHWSVHVISNLEDYLLSGKRRVQRFIETQKVVSVTMPSQWQDLSNFNTPEEYQRALESIQLCQISHI